MICAVVGALMYIALAFGLAVVTGRLIRAGMGDDDERRERDGDQSE